MWSFVIGCLADILVAAVIVSRILDHMIKVETAYIEEMRKSAA